MKACIMYVCVILGDVHGTGATSVFSASAERARLFSKRCKTLGCHFSGQLAHFSWFLLYHGFDHGDRDNGVAECKPGG